MYVFRSRGFKRYSRAPSSTARFLSNGFAELESTMKGGSVVGALLFKNLEAGELRHI